MNFIDPKPRHRLTPLKVNRAMEAIQDLLYCRDLPDMTTATFRDYGDVRGDLEHTLVDVIGPLQTLLDEAGPA